MTAAKTPDGTSIRMMLLKAAESTKEFPDVLNEAATRLNAGNNEDLQRAILSEWQALFNCGYVAWGENLLNPGGPSHGRFHLTAHGGKTLENLSRDPANPAGYMSYLR